MNDIPDALVDPYEWLAARGVRAVWDNCGPDVGKPDGVIFALPPGWQWEPGWSRWLSLSRVADAWRPLLLLQVRGRHKGAYRPVRQLIEEGVVAVRGGRYVQVKAQELWWL